MNLDLGEPYSIHSFESTRGRDGGTLWSQFQSSYQNAFIAHSIYKPACESGIYKEVYNGAIQKASFSRKLTFAVLYKFKQMTYSSSTREKINLF